MLPHEEFLWACARNWRAPSALAVPPELDGAALVSLALRNKAQTMLQRALSGLDAPLLLPADSAQALARGNRKHVFWAGYLGEALYAFLESAARRDLPVVVIKGLWLCEKLYNDPAMRPGADIDLLLRRADVPAAIEILERDMDYGRWWRPLLDDRYYYRHHLHQQRCNADRSIWIEPHWLLDHPYTQLTVDYEAMLARARPAELWGLPLLELEWPDLLISLCIHLVKHAVYLPYSLGRPDLARLILADGMLMYYLDIAEALRLAADDPPWERLVEAANRAGAGSLVAAVLETCARLLDAPAPPDMPARFHRAKQGALSRRMMIGLGDAILAAYEGRSLSQPWSFLLGYHASVVFRPIRLLDFAHYLWPEEDFLRRRYGSGGSGARAGHLARAAWQYAGVGLDTVRFALQRKLEVRRLSRHGQYWPPAPVDLFAALPAEQPAAAPDAPLPGGEPALPGIMLGVGE